MNMTSKLRFLGFTPGVLALPLLCGAMLTGCTEKSDSQLDEKLIFTTGKKLSYQIGAEKGFALDIKVKHLNDEILCTTTITPTNSEDFEKIHNLILEEERYPHSGYRNQIFITLKDRDGFKVDQIPILTSGNKPTTYRDESGKRYLEFSNHQKMNRASAERVASFGVSSSFTDDLKILTGGK